MTRLSRASIERSLLAGDSVPWKNAAGKSFNLRLPDAAQRRLFRFLLLDPNRDPKQLADEFIEGLYAAYAEPTVSPSGKTSDKPLDSTTLLPALPWKLQAIETEGFGGLNTFGGPIFGHVFDGASLLGDGENGSGKSSLIGAIVWAMTGKKPRDQANDQAETNEQVVGRDDKVVGSWPPIATYPTDASSLATPPQVRVKLTFRAADGREATIERTLAGGQVTSVWSDQFKVPDIFVETGLLMPMRLAHLKFKEGAQLSQVVQMLTGLNEMSAVGTLAGELTHAGRRFLSYAKDNELSMHRTRFEKSLEAAGSALASAKKSVPQFTPSDANTIDGEQGKIVNFGVEIAKKAADLTRTLEDDLVPGLQLFESAVQENIGGAIHKAKERLALGLPVSRTWKLLQKCGEHMDGNALASLNRAIQGAKIALQDAIALHQQSQIDTRMQLKAVASAWQQKHGHGATDECPLCETTLGAESPLGAELKKMQSLGEAAQRALDDNVRRVSQSLADAVPPELEPDWMTLASLSPGDALNSDLRDLFVDDKDLKGVLSKFVTLAADLLAASPSFEQPQALSVIAASPTARAATAIERAERVIKIAQWFSEHEHAWTSWWEKFRGPTVPSGDDVSATTTPLAIEGLAQHADRLGLAMAEAAPYRIAANELREAVKEGREISKIEAVQGKRDQIATALAPLKDLVPLSESVARETIEGLSEKTGKILGEMHSAERLPFRGTSLQKKEGIVVRAGFGPDVRIDATLIANTSWLRSVLWAFLFAMRAEAVEQHGHDPFPLILFDDPQATFDRHHRKMWAAYVASLQAGASAMQVVMLSHDIGFLDAAVAMKISGRRALLAPAIAPSPYMQILEGDALERTWIAAENLKTSSAAWTYLSEARVFLEGMLKVMLQGEAPAVASETIGKLKLRLQYLHASDRTPWERVEFEVLLAALHGENRLVGLLEQSHHTPRAELDFTDARSVHVWFRDKLIPQLEACFRLSREWHGVHGNTGGFHHDPPRSTLPQGYEQLLRAFSLPVLGRASAFEGSSAADGRVVYSQIGDEVHETIRLGKHWAYRLTARTMEPVASVGDLLIVRQHGAPPPRSLVVARWEDRVVARRFEISDSRPDVAVLTAQCVDPLAIAAPLVALRGSLSLHEVVGVVFDGNSSVPASSTDEVCDCGGEAMLTSRLPNSIGLAKVSGDSAQPLVLDGQHLFIGPACALNDLRRLDGKPVIAIDSDEASYFKRLRLVGSDLVVLESLDASGIFPPVLLSLDEERRHSKSLSMVYPVLGVLFSS